MKEKYLLFTVFIIIFLVFINHTARAQDADYRITSLISPSLQGGNNSRKVARTRDGKLWAVYAKRPPGETYTQIGVAKSTDGVNWTKNIITELDYTQKQPSIAVDRRDNLHVVWAGKSALYPNNYNIRYCKKPAGSGWQSPHFITTNGLYNNEKPAIAVGSMNAPSSSDHIWVVWEKETSGQPVIYYSTRTLSTLWSYPASVCSQPNYSGYSPSIAVDDNNIPHACWYGKLLEGSKDQIRYVSSIPTGGAEGVTAVITGLSNQNHYDPCLALLTDGMTPIITWVGWSEDMPEFHVSNSPNIHCAWKSGGNWDHARLSTYYFMSNKPEQPTISSTSPDNPGHPRLHVAWHVHTNSPEAPYSIGYSYTHDLDVGWCSPWYKQFSYLGDTCPTMIWANWPEFGGKKSNRPLSGFPLVFINQGTASSYGFYYWLFSGITIWEDIPPATPTPTPRPTPKNTPIPGPTPKNTPIPGPTPKNTPIPGPTPKNTPVTPALAAAPWITDYDGDGTSDIAIFRGDSGLWAIRGITRVYFGESMDETVPGDYDGDGTTEIGIFRGASGLWAIRGASRAYFGGGSDLPEPGDYDGDGTDNIGIFRGSSGLWAIRGVTRVYFGGAEDLPASGYYDGYSTKEIGIFRESSGLWAIRNVTRLYFGSSSDTIVPGDYDGDGTWEPGIFRETSGLWAIRGMTRSYFGGGSDRPVPGVYKGNGTDNIGIFRGSSGLWAIRGVSRVYFGTTGDLPVTR